MARRFVSASCMFLLSLQALAGDWPFQTYSTAPFQPPKLNVTKTGDIAPGYIFIGPRGNEAAGTAALIYDEDGNLVYQGPDEVTANFKVQKLFGQDVITFWAGNMMDLGFGYGTVHILDNTYQEIYTVTLTGNFVSPDGSIQESYIDLHESHVTDRNTLLVTAYNVTQGDLRSIGGQENAFMLDGQFYEIDIPTNEIIHSWSALEHPEDIPFTDSKQGLGDAGTQEMPWDAYHINSVTAVNEGYIISLRHTWSGYYVHNNGSIMWRLGGEDGADFTIDKDATFSWQHDMRVFDETPESLVLDLFNNANTPTEQGQATTGLSLAVDIANRKVSALRVLSDPEDPIHSVSQGSYQRVDSAPGHVVMGYGSISKVKEFDAEGQEIFTAEFGFDNQVASYRGYKCEWKATPFWKPAFVVTRTSENAANISMSWNGATEYDNWAVYSVESEDAINKQLIVAYSRTGFETFASIGNLTTNYLQVVARKGGEALGTSDVVQF